MRFIPHYALRWGGVLLVVSLIVFFYRLTQVPLVPPQEETVVHDDITLHSSTFVSYGTAPGAPWQVRAEKALCNKKHKHLVMLDQATLTYSCVSITAHQCQLDRKNQSLDMHGGVKTVLSL
jgi:hypothetical protein